MHVAPRLCTAEARFAECEICAFGVQRLLFYKFSSSTFPRLIIVLPIFFTLLSIVIPFMVLVLSPFICSCFFDTSRFQFTAQRGAACCG